MTANAQIDGSHVSAANDNSASRLPASERRSWRRRYSRFLWCSDLIVLSTAVFATQLIWFRTGNAAIALSNDTRMDVMSYWLLSIILIVVWMAALTLVDSRSTRVIGTGPTEYVRVAHASFALFSVVAIFCFLARIDIARGYFLIALPLGIAVLLAERHFWRRWLLAKRARDSYSARVVLVGSEVSVRQIARELARTPGAGYHVVGACIPAGHVGLSITGTRIPVLGDVDQVAFGMAVSGADTVIVTSTDELSPTKVKQISWDLEAGRQHLVLAPSIVDIAGPRIHMRPVSGLPLIHVETPRFSDGQRFVKRATDVILCVIGVTLLSPLFAALAMIVRLSSPGPVLFRQRRVGKGGREFTMLKFRSMVEDAEDLLADLAAQKRDAGNEVLFKLKDDPRITPIGKIMRKFSLDELPQLFNVIGGSMSLVGPRPPLPSEVALYADHVHRRFLVKPGITGIWQVSGRSTLSWEESVRLDLSYVENWSLLGDFVILLKTGKAVLAPGSTAH